MRWNFPNIATALLGCLSVLPSAFGWTNPIRNPGGSDPFVAYSGGYYYLLTTSWTNVEIARSTTVAGLKTAAKKVVYSSTTASRCCNVWAPEVHYLGGKWYIYFTAGNADNLDGQRLHVLSGGRTPWDDYTYTGQLTKEWSIDASVLRFNAWGNFLMFSCFHGAKYQSICLQQLGSDYVSLTGEIHVISQPTLPFEKNSHPVNEGPVALYFNGVTYIVYSASYCWSPDYCLGQLTWDGTSDPRTAAAWTKHNGCVLSSANGNYGTGHNSFFLSPDGTETWIAYHATSNSAGACDNSRYTMIQSIGKHTNGTPNFGKPAHWSHAYGEPSS
ncbi:glycosyl hydrolase, family 43 [Aspergillus ochraceoroseus]|nr:glycosyl hydrolase, family 43 [Aspergillus ochraceoroseus]